MKQTDEELLAAVAQKDEEAFVTFYDRYGRLAYKFVYNITQDQDMANDILQDFWLKLWENPSILNYKGYPSVKSYMQGYLRFRIYDAYRISLNDTMPLEEYIMQLEDSENSYVLEDMDEKLLVDIINEAFVNQSETMRKVFWMRINDYSVKETAKALSLSRQSLYNRYHESLNLVREHLLKNYPEIVPLFSHLPEKQRYILHVSLIVSVLSEYVG